LEVGFLQVKEKEKRKKRIRRIKTFKPDLNIFPLISNPIFLNIRVYTSKPSKKIVDFILYDFVEVRYALSLQNLQSLLFRETDP
jgi:hypothetical protein